MNKLKRVAQDIGLLLITLTSAGFYHLSTMCGSTVRCHRYITVYHSPLIFTAVIIGLISIVDIILTISTPDKKILNGKRILFAIFTLISLAIFALFNS